MYEIRRLAYEDLPALAKMYSYYAQHTVTTYCNHEVSPQYMNGLKQRNITINRKMLADIAVNDPAAFTKLVETVKG